MIKTRDQHSYKWFEYNPAIKTGHKNSQELYSALNTEKYRLSLKEAYGNHSMQEKQEIIVEEETKEDTVMSRATLYTYQDEIKLRAKRPLIQAD